MGINMAVLLHTLKSGETEEREKKGPGTRLWDTPTLDGELEEEAAKETEEERPVRQKRTGES